jgi:hypothetical protein
MTCPSDGVNMQLGVDNKWTPGFKCPTHDFRTERKEVFRMKLRAIKWLVPLAALILAAIGGEGPWPPM